MSTNEQFQIMVLSVMKSDGLPIQLAAGCLCLANSLFGGYAAFREVGLLNLDSPTHNPKIL